MYQLSRLEYIEKDCIFGSQVEQILIELYIDYRTNKKYILNKIWWSDYAYVKEYFFDELKDDIFIMPYDYDDELIYGKNSLSSNSWRITSSYNREDYLTEIDIV